MIFIVKLGKETPMLTKSAKMRLLKSSVDVMLLASLSLTGVAASAQNTVIPSQNSSKPVQGAPIATVQEPQAQTLQPMPNLEPIPVPTPMSVKDYYSAKMTPKEIEDVKKREVNREEAAARVSISGSVVAKTISLDLQGSSRPHKIRIAQGYGTSVVFVDSTGSPWPIRRVDNFNAAALGLLGFEGEKSPTKDCHTDTVNSFSVFAISRFDSGVINVFLCDTAVPVVFDFNSDAKAKDVDNPVEVRALSKGPLAKAEPVVYDGRPTYSSILLALLDGQIPAVAQPLLSGHPQMQAWNLAVNSEKNGNGRILLKTDLTIFSPAPIEQRSGANGVSAYLMPATPVVLVSDKSGRVLSVILADKPI